MTTVNTDWPVYTRASAVGRDAPNTSGTYVKTLPPGSPFRIRSIHRNSAGQVWVKSQPGDWYQFSNNLFEDASCHAGARVYLAPTYPSDHVWLTGKPSSGRLYAAERQTSQWVGTTGYGYYPRHTQAAV